MSSTVWLAGFALLILGSYLARMLGHPGEAKALRAVARERGWQFVPGLTGGPAIRITVQGGEGEARFRAGKRRFLLGRHVRARTPLPDASDVSLRIVPPMRKRGRAMQVIHPSPTPSDFPGVDRLYDVHASSPSLLQAALADGTADTLTRRHPHLWL